ncbi:Fic-domain-containing protein [Aspergillus steynii IBT 23096]|uniref:Fic-domain-containing protein n=1 Tax=Aspergillus steynii IBT 23096 TaxID=1392250 RepID=A0A2I2G7C4_9EURO|nr:Fic-domain-containing protein [Aspergillus steynii IBT 23096]PLB48789.1 Fic-domain-containing protein [Aspergillus steynii IBT 23096]
MDSGTAAYIVPNQESPSDLFKKATDFCSTIQERVTEKGSGGFKILSNTLTKQSGTAIFGSNYIESAGLDLEETINICERVFRGEHIHSGTLTSHIVRSRREVIQHALAFQHIITRMVLNDEPLTEELILNTHYILTKKIDTPGGTSWREYSGKYRTVHVHAGATNFVTPKYVPTKVRELVSEFEADITRIEASQDIDPFTLAAKYCSDFVMIHPFVDGNGRMCRLILNAILLKYAGIVLCLGENDESRQQYLDIQRRAGERMEGSGELAALILKKSIARYRTLKQKLAGKKAPV